MRPRLILYPRVPDSLPVARDHWHDALFDAGFIGDPLPALGAGHYRAGAEFLSCVSFLGCSPALDLDGPQHMDDDGPNLYSVELSPVKERAVLIGEPVRAPRCPHCGAGDEGWRQHRPADVQDNLQCPRCGEVAAMYRWNWRRQAGFGRYWIDVHGVHEGEAVPTDTFLGLLENLSDAVWDYAYSRS